MYFKVGMLLYSPRGVLRVSSVRVRMEMRTKSMNRQAATGHLGKTIRVVDGALGDFSFNHPSTQRRVVIKPMSLVFFIRFHVGE
jgi:hypothetical protein